MIDSQKVTLNTKEHRTTDQPTNRQSDQHNDRQIDVKKRNYYDVQLLIAGQKDKQNVRMTETERQIDGMAKRTTDRTQNDRESNR